MGRATDDGVELRTNATIASVWTMFKSRAKSTIFGACCPSYLIEIDGRAQRRLGLGKRAHLYGECRQIGWLSFGKSLQESAGLRNIVESGL